MIFFLRCAAVATTLALTACGGSSDSEIDKGGPLPSSQPTENVAITNASTRVSLERVWLGAAQIEGKCNEHHAKVTYDRTTHEASWHVCREGAYVDRVRVLAEGEVTQIESQLTSITFKSNPPCDGYDGLYLTMTVLHADGTSRTYAKENINCYGLPKAEGIVSPFQFLLAKM